MDAGPDVDRLENSLIKSNEKIHILCDKIAQYELMLKDVNNKLEYSDAKCDQLSKDNERLCDIENDLSKQVYYYKK